MLTLMYHNIVGSMPDPALSTIAEQVTLETFRRQVESIQRNVIHPLEVDRLLRQGRKTNGILLTFDDGGKGLLRASTILAELNLTAVAFVCPEALHYGLWFYELAWALVHTTEQRIVWHQYDLSLQTLAERNQAYYKLIEDLGGMQSAERRSRLDSLMALLLTNARVSSHEAYGVLNEQEMKQAASSGHLIFANHTWSHADLAQLAPDEGHREIENAYQWLSSSGLPYLHWLAFPRGHYSNEIVDIAAKTCTAMFGAAATEPHPLVLSRVGIYAADRNPLRFWLKVGTPIPRLINKRNMRETRLY